MSHKRHGPSVNPLRSNRESRPIPNGPPRSAPTPGPPTAVTDPLGARIHTLLRLRPSSVPLARTGDQKTAVATICPPTPPSSATLRSKSCPTTPSRSISSTRPPSSLSLRSKLSAHADTLHSRYQKTKNRRLSHAPAHPTHTFLSPSDHESPATSSPSPTLLAKPTPNPKWLTHRQVRPPGSHNCSPESTLSTTRICRP